MITALRWVKRGAASREPKRYQMTEEEEEMMAAAAGQLSMGDDEEDEVEGNNGEAEPVEPIKQKKTGKGARFHADEDLIKEFDLDNYDDEEDEEDEDGVKMYGAGMKGLMYYADNDQDPYITLKDDDDGDDEIDDLTIKETDNIVLCAKTEEEFSNLEVYVYEEADSNLFVHHDVLLPAYPLCLEWVNFNPTNGQKGNFVAIGTMKPGVEIWDLDVLDALEPAAVMGGELSEEEMKKALKKKKGKKKTMREKLGLPSLKPDSHKDAVLGLAWNPHQPHVLASASADCSIKLWDMTRGTCLATLEHHRDKVQSVQWHPVEQGVLLTGSFDKTVACLNVVQPQSVSKWNVSSDVEALAWNPHAAQNFLVATDDGLVQCFNGLQSGSKAIYTIAAHDKGVTSLAFSPIPGMLATTSTDNTIKVWDISDDKPSCIYTKKTQGPVFSAAYCMDSPFVLSYGGGEGKLHVWVTSDNTSVWKRFGAKASAETQKIVAEKQKQREEKQLKDDDDAAIASTDEDESDPEEMLEGADTLEEQPDIDLEGGDADDDDDDEDVTPKKSKDKKKKKKDRK